MINEYSVIITIYILLSFNCRTCAFMMVGQIITSDQSKFEKRSHQRRVWTVFARLRQCAQPPNTCFLGPTRVHIPKVTSIGSVVFVQFNAGRSYTLQWAASFPSRCGSGPHLMHGFLGSPESTTKTASPSGQRFLQGSRS